MRVFTSCQIRGSLIPAIKGLVFLQLGAPQVLTKILDGEGFAPDSIADVIVYGILVVNHALDVVPVGGIDNIHLIEFIALDIAVLIPLSVPLKTAGGLVLCGIKLAKICVCGNFAHGGTQLVRAQVDPLNGFAGVPILVDLEPYAALKGFRCGGIDIGKGGRSRNNSLGLGFRRPGTAVRYKSFLGGHSLRNSRAQGGSAVGGWLAFTIDFGHIDDLIAIVDTIPGAAANGIGHLELPDVGLPITCIGTGSRVGLTHIVGIPVQIQDVGTLSKSQSGHLTLSREVFVKVTGMSSGDLRFNFPSSGFRLVFLNDIIQIVVDGVFSQIGVLFTSQADFHSNVYTNAAGLGQDGQLVTWDAPDLIS